MFSKLRQEEARHINLFIDINIPLPPNTPPPLDSERNIPLYLRLQHRLLHLYGLSAPPTPSNTRK